MMMMMMMMMIMMMIMMLLVVRFAIRHGLYRFWNSMEIDDAIPQYLERFGKEKFFKMAIGKF